MNRLWNMNSGLYWRYSLIAITIAQNQRDGQRKRVFVRHRCIRLFVAIGWGLTFFFFFCFFAFFLISKFQSILLIRIPFLVEKPPSKCTRLAFDSGQIITTTTIRRRNSTFWPAASSERPWMVVLWSRWHNLWHWHRTTKKYWKLYHWRRSQKRSWKGANICSRRI